MTKIRMDSFGFSTSTSRGERLAGMSSLWNQPGVPQRGWKNVDVFDLRANGEPGDETVYATCQMCGNERIRFVHVMRHVEYGQLEVGCICAEKMSEDYVGPRQRESGLRNKAAREAKWLTRKWRRSSKGNQFLNIDGMNLVIFPNRFKPGRWNFGIDGEFSRESYATPEEAKLALFEEFWDRTQG